LELYRRSSLGMALTDALDDMVTSGELAPVLAMKVLAEFDRSMAEELKSSNCKISIKGDLHTYRFCDNVWTFLLEDVCLKSFANQGNVFEHALTSLKIVVCDGKILATSST
ncbi:transcription factor IIA small subunit, partial [Ostreococcus tauri]